MKKGKRFQTIILALILILNVPLLAASSAPPDAYFLEEISKESAFYETNGEMPDAQLDDLSAEVDSPGDVTPSDPGETEYPGEIPSDVPKNPEADEEAPTDKEIEPTADESDPEIEPALIETPLPELLSTTWPVVYLNGEAGDDLNGDGTLENPYATFDAAKSALAIGGTIEVTGKVTIDSEQTWDGGLTGLTILRHSDYQGRLLEVTSSGRLTLANLTIDGNLNAEQISGSMIYVDGGTLELAALTSIQNNILSAPGQSGAIDGGGIDVRSGGIVTMRSGATITNNHAQGGAGGGIYAEAASSIFILGGVISENSAGGGGGGLYLQDSQLTMNGGRISGNRAEGVGVGGYGGGLYLSGQADATINNVTISSNRAGYGGGAIYAENGSITAVSGTEISYNSAQLGGGLYLTSLRDSGSFSLQGCDLVGNTAQNNGGGFYLANSATITLEDSHLDGNYAYQGGGAYGSGQISLFGRNTVNNNTATASGGGIYLLAELNEAYSGTVSLRGEIEIHGNQAKSNGGGLYLGTGCTMDMDVNTVLNVTGNRARNGGGLYAGYNIYYTRDQAGAPIIGTANYVSNTATSNGGGIYKSGNLELGSGYVRANMAGENGGGIYMASAEGYLIINGQEKSRDIDNVPTTAVVGGNSAGHNGGGIYLKDISNLQLSLVAFLRNTAAVGYVCPDPENRHPEDWVIYNNTIRDREELEIIGGSGIWFAASIGSWIYNNYDVYYTDSCEDASDAYAILAQWISKEVDGSQKVAYAYTANGQKGALVSLPFDGRYDRFIDIFGTYYDDASPDEFLQSAGYRYESQDPLSSDSTYTFGNTTVVKFYYLAGEKSLLPTVDNLTSASTTISGGGVPGADIIITLDRASLNATVAADGRWAVALPEGLVLREREVIQIRQQEPERRESDPVIIRVGAPTLLPDGVVITRVRFFPYGEAVLADVNNDPDTYETQHFENYAQGLDIWYELQANNTFDRNQPAVISLPDGILSAASRDIEVKDSSGEHLLFTITTEKNSNKLHLTFTEYASQEVGAFHAYFYFGARFDREALEEGDNEIVFELGSGEGEKIQVTVSDHEPTIFKTGEYHGFVADQGAIIDWTVEINTNNVALAELSLADSLPPGLAYLPGSENITFLDGTDAADDWLLVTDDLDHSRRQWDHVGEKPTTAAYRFRFQTVVTDLALFQAARDNSYIVPNTASLTFTHPDSQEANSFTDTATVVFDLGFITKNISRMGSTNEFRWYIDINTDSYELTDVVITDTLSPGLQFGFKYPTATGSELVCPDFMKPTDITHNFAVLGLNGTDLGWQAGVDYKLEFGTYTDPDGTECQQLRILFQRTVDRPLRIRLYGFYGHPDDLLEKDERAHIANKAVITWGENGDSWGLADDLRTGIGEGDYNFFALTKTVGFDPKTQTITWTIALNTSRLELNQVVVRDVIGAGHELLGSKEDDWGVKVYTDTAYTQRYDPSLYQVNQVDFSAAQLKAWGIENPGAGHGLEITFPQLSNVVYIRYQSRITDLAHLLTNDLGGKRYFNDVFLYADELPDYVHKHAYQQVPAHIIDKLNTNFDYAANQITWAVVVNQYNVTLGDQPEDSFTITDTVPAGQAYVEDSLSVVWEDREGNFGPLPPERYQLSWQPGKNPLTSDGLLTIVFPAPGSWRYTLYFETEILDFTVFDGSDEFVRFDNRAEFSSTLTPGVIGDDAYCEVKKTVLDKAAEYTAGTDFIDWKVTINPTACDFDLSGIELTDTLPSGLELSPDSVYLTKYLINAADYGGQGSTPYHYDQIFVPENIVKVEKLTVTQQGSTFTITLPKDISNQHAYVLTYQTKVTVDGVYANSITLTGHATSYSETFELAVDHVLSGGSGATSAYTLQIQKTGETGQALPDAEFYVQRQNNLAIAGSGVSNDAGQIEIRELRFNIPYFLSESIAPSGYLARDENIPLHLTYDGASIHLVEPASPADFYTVDWDESTLTLTITVENTPDPDAPPTCSFSLLKVDAADSSLTLANAEFALYDNGLREGNPVAFGKTDENGKLLLANILYDRQDATTYYLFELTAPSGYQLPTAPTVITIESDGTIYADGLALLTQDEAGSLLLTLENQQKKPGPEPKPHSRALSLLKIDALTEFPLANAEFALFDNPEQEGIPIATGISDDNGKLFFPDLVYHSQSITTYYLFETAAPPGYLPSVGYLTITIDTHGNVLVDGEPLAFSEEDPSGLLIVKNNRRPDSVPLSCALRLVKVAATTKSPLANAQFALYYTPDQADEPLATGTTDSDGTLLFTNLRYNNLAPTSYYLFETDAPAGYKLLSGYITITIDEQGNCYADELLLPYSEDEDMHSLTVENLQNPSTSRSRPRGSGPSNTPDEPEVVNEPAKPDEPETREELPVPDDKQPAEPDNVPVEEPTSEPEPNYDQTPKTGASSNVPLLMLLLGITALGVLLASRLKD